MNTLAAIIAAFLFGMVTVPVAALSGNSQSYCENVLQGTYTPGAKDVCPDGNWSHLVGVAKEKLPNPK